MLGLSSEFLAILAAGALCGVWVVFQLWIARVDPENQGVRGSCGACSGGVCHGGCEVGVGDGKAGERGNGVAGDGGENVVTGTFGGGGGKR